MVPPRPGKVCPITGALTLPTAYSSAVTLPSSRSVRARTTVRIPPLLPRSPGTVFTAKYGGCLISPRLALGYDRLITVTGFTVKGSDRPDLGRGGHRLLRGRRAARATGCQRTGRRGRRRLPRGHLAGVSRAPLVRASSTVATSFVPTMDVAIAVERPRHLPDRLLSSRSHTREFR